MKKCINCGKESTGNFCVSCGGILKEETEIQEEIKETLDELVKDNKKIEYIENDIKTKSNTKNIFLYLFIVAVIVIIGMGIYLIYNYNEQKDEISSLKSQISKLKKEKSDLQDENWDYLMENIDYKDKAEFLDENIVFVLDGYGNYYYTYDQVQQVTQGKEYSYWAYNKEAAISRGYRAWK